MTIPPALTKKPNRANSCQICNQPYMVTIMDFRPVRVMVSCCCNVQFLTAEEATTILEEVKEEVNKKNGE
jgi:hypothetical protein